MTTGGGGLGEVKITLSNGTPRTRVTTSASNPAGSYSFVGIAPGVYTVQFERSGYATKVVSLRVEAGVDATINTNLAALVKTLAWPDTVAVAPGESGLISVAVTNSSSVIDAYRVQVFGLDPSWVEIEPARLSLFPGETANVAVNLRLPVDYPASQRTLTVNVASDDDPGSFALNQIELAVQPRTKTSLQMDPKMITGGKRATFGMVIGNDGNAPVTASAYAIDPEDLAEFTFDPAEVVVAPGREQVIQVTAEGGRSWFGPPRPRTFTFGVDAETPSRRSPRSSSARGSDAGC